MKSYNGKERVQSLDMFAMYWCQNFFILQLVNLKDKITNTTCKLVLVQLIYGNTKRNFCLNVTIHDTQQYYPRGLAPMPLDAGQEARYTVFYIFAYT